MWKVPVSSVKTERYDLASWRGIAVQVTFCFQIVFRSWLISQLDMVLQRTPSRETLKNCVYRDVISGKCVINHFAEHADKSIKGIKSFYLPAEVVLIEPDDIEESPKIKETLQIHMVKRFFDQRKVVHLEFYAMSTDQKPFFHSILWWRSLWTWTNLHRRLSLWFLFGWLSNKWRMASMPYMPRLVPQRLILQLTENKHVLDNF